MTHTQVVQLSRRFAVKNIHLYCLLVAFSCFLDDVKGQQLGAVNRGGAVSAHLSPRNYVNKVRMSGQPALSVLQFSKLPDVGEQSSLASQGIVLKEFIGDLSFTAIIYNSQPKTAIPFPASLLKASNVPAAAKITNAIDGDKKLPGRTLVSCFDEIEEADFLNQLKQAGGSLIKRLSPSISLYEVSLCASCRENLAEWYGVRSISVVGESSSLNFESLQATGSIAAQTAVNLGGRGLQGDSIVIGIGDNSSGVYHIDVSDRVINYNPMPFGSHGQHVSGTVGANGIMDRRGEGFAPHATIVNHQQENVWLNTGVMRAKHNMRATNNSYTAVIDNCGYAGIYDILSQAVDNMAIQFPDVLHVFAAGNNGNMNCTPYTNGFRTVTGTFQPAKNILTVGQCDKDFAPGVNSSKGPVRDGRLKPEMVAIGTDIISTRGDDIYLRTGGTSMASPQVAGAAGLLQQRYKQLHNHNYPSAALLKTLLMNGATDKGNVGPDYTYGFGVLNTERSMLQLDSNRFIEGNIASGAAAQEIVITVPSNTAMLKVMLYWPDPTASLLSSNKLINNLDLEVKNALNIVTLPLVLDGSAGGVELNAQPGVDNKNNVEQVVLYNPAAGSYTITVKATQIPIGSQNYVVAYDIVEKGVKLTYPIAGSALSTHIPARIYWETDDTINTANLQYSTNNGSSWNSIASNIGRKVRSISWSPSPSISTNQCKIRITIPATSQQFTTGSFVINTEPTTFLNSVQCPGYISFSWLAVPNATSYRVLRKKGFQQEIVAITTDTFYNYSGLSLDSTYYVAVQPLVNGTPGYRSQSKRRKPNTGTCTGGYSNGDLLLQALVSPVSGRVLTSSELSANTSLTVLIQNLDDVPANNYRISYKLNNGGWQSQIMTTTIPANSAVPVTIPTTFNLSATGNYRISVAVTNLAQTDNVSGNDTLFKTIRHLQNPPINIISGFTEDFESSAEHVIVRDSMGITPNEHWDYRQASDTGRMYTYLTDEISIAGNRSMAMTTRMCSIKPVTNSLIGTFNVAGQNLATTELRLDFLYKMHGNSIFADSNKVWVRSADSLQWLPIFSYNRDAKAGNINRSGSLSITDAIRNSGGDFTSSMQIRFGQQDSTLIATNNSGGGMSLDNIRIYTVAHDVQTTAILSPTPVNCDIANTPISVSVTNGVSTTENNIAIAYQLDNAPVISETIASLAGKTSVTHNFSTLIGAITPGLHQLKVWISNAGDTYLDNDTVILNFRNLPRVDTFPHLQQFEDSDGGFYTEGRNTSWEYGTPASTNVTRAASGANAWKTNLSGRYKAAEKSYLYSACYNIAGLMQPMLSFSAITAVENCGTLICDAAWVDYSLDGGTTWIKLGASGQGYSWYTQATEQVWDQSTTYRWHVASVPLPVTSQPIRLRFALSSDEAFEDEGLAIDDIHIYNKTENIYNGISPSAVVAQNVNGNGFVNFATSGSLLAQVNPHNQNLGTSAGVGYIHNSPIAYNQKYYLGRNYILQPGNSPVDSVTVRLFVTDAEVNALLNASFCPSCSKPVDGYRLGIAKYHDPTGISENGSITDNIIGTWTRIPATKVKWVPYDNGYYAETRLQTFSELWFNDATVLQALAVGLKSFEIAKYTSSALLNWALDDKELYTTVILERSTDGRSFAGLYQSADLRKQQSYLDKMPENGMNYYRLALTDKGGKTYYSNILAADFTDRSREVRVAPNPANTVISISWMDRTSPVTIMLHNAIGQCVYATTVEPGNGKYQLPLGNIGTGSYLLTWKQDGVTRHSKVQVIK